MDRPCSAFRAGCRAVPADHSPDVSGRMDERDAARRTPRRVQAATLRPARRIHRSSSAHIYHGRRSTSRVCRSRSSSAPSAQRHERRLSFATRCATCSPPPARSSASCRWTTTRSCTISARTGAARSRAHGSTRTARSTCFPMRHTRQLRHADPRHRGARVLPRRDAAQHPLRDHRALQFRDARFPRSTCGSTRERPSGPRTRCNAPGLASRR